MPDARTHALWIVLFTTAVGGTACAPSVCPTAPEQLSSTEFSGIGDDTIVGVGHVIRYVNSPELDSRGYDVGLRRTIRGESSAEGTFLRVPAAIPGIRDGQAVMLIAEPGRRAVVVPGVCVPLVPIGEDEVEPG